MALINKTIYPDTKLTNIYKFDININGRAGAYSNRFYFFITNQSSLISQFSRTMPAEKATHITLISRYQRSKMSCLRVKRKELAKMQETVGGRMCHKHFESASIAFPRIDQRENEDTSEH